MVASAKRGKRRGRKSFVYKKESFGKKENIVFMLCGVRKEGKVFFRLRLKKKISSTSKHFSYINGRIRIYNKVSTKVISKVLVTKVISKVPQVLSTVYHLISKELRLRRHF